MNNITNSQLKWYIESFQLLMYSMTEAVDKLYEELDSKEQMRYDELESCMYQCMTELYNRGESIS